MDLFSIDLFDDDETFSAEELSELMEQVNAIIRNEKETSQRRAGAYVIKFQLLKIEYKLDPKLLENALELYPDMPEALTCKGCFYLHINKKDKALTCFNKAIEADPLFPYSWLQKAYLENNEEEKLRLLDEFIRLKPDSIKGYEEKKLLLEYEFDDELGNFGYSLKNIKLKHLKNGIQRQIDNYSELIRLDPANSYYYEDRAKLYMYISKIDFMVSDDDEIFPSVNYNAVKDMEKLMSLPLKIDIYNLIVTIHNLLNDFPNETNKKYIEQLIAELPPETEAFWIAQILYAENCDEREEKIAKYSDIINSVKEGKLLQIQCYCYSNRSKNYLLINECEKALDDNAMYIKLLPLLPNEQNRNQEDNAYYAMKDRTEILKKMKDTNGLINEYTKILETLFAEKKVPFYYITDTYMKRAQLYRKNNNIEKALADYSAVIELGATGIEYKVKNAYAARMEINKELGEMDKVSADYKKMSELKERDLDGEAFTAIPRREFEIISEV